MNVDNINLEIKWVKTKDIDGNIYTAFIDDQKIAQIQKGYCRASGNCWIITGTELTELGKVVSIGHVGESTLKWAKSYVNSRAMYKIPAYIALVTNQQ